MLVEGMDTKDEDKIYDIRQTVGMVFQSPDNQIVATVVEGRCRLCAGKSGRAAGGDAPPRG